MNLERVKEFIRQVQWGMLATSDGRAVGVRPMAGLEPKPVMVCRYRIFQ